jgi:ribosome recycling factor
MRRAVVKEFEQLGEKLSNYNAIFAYRLMNLCVKAEEVSLLPVEAFIEGELQKLEDCTTISKKDEYSFMIFPIYDEDLPAIGQALLRVHPEFKQKIESMTVKGVDINGHLEDADVRYILVTMPEVDDNRYDALKDGVKLCYEECKAQMDAENLKADAKFATLTVGESEDDMKKLKDGREQLNDQWFGQRDNLYNSKLQEIEEAHNKWLSEEAEKNQKLQDEDAARGNGVGSQMRMIPEDGEFVN